MDPLVGLPKKYAGRLPRVPSGSSPCTNIMLNVVNCYFESNFEQTGPCLELARSYERCKKTHVSGARRVALLCPACVALTSPIQVDLGKQKSFQYKRLIKKVRLGMI